MNVAGFVLQDRGPFLFDRWEWPERVPTALGELAVQLTSDADGPPDAAMAATASELAEFATARGDALLDLIYGHYRYAEENDWLQFWRVPAGLRRDEVLSQVVSVALAVHRGDDGCREAAVFVDPRWDAEHKLELVYDAGDIVLANGEPFELVDGVLRPV